MNTRLNTIPSNTTIVKAAKYRGMEVPHSTQDRATPTRTASRRQLSEQAFLARAVDSAIRCARAGPYVTLTI